MTARLVGRQSSAEAGFSLVEVLVTLAILLAFMVTFTPFVGRLVSSWARNADGAQRADMVATAIGSIARDAAAALPAAEFAEGADPRVRFTGTSSGYTLVVAGEDAEETVAVSRSGGGPGAHSLVRVARPALQGATREAPASRVALLDYPVTAEFAYRSAKGKEVSDWRDSPTLPSGIVVTFRRGKDLMFGGPVVVPVRSTLPVECVVAEQPPEALCGTPAPAASGDENPSAAGAAPAPAKAAMPDAAAGAQKAGP